MGHQGADRHATKRRLDPEAAKTVAATLHALANPSRLLILSLLEAGPSTVGELIEALGMEQSAVSHQLRHLRDLGFVTTERQGRHVIYRLYDANVGELLEQARFHAEHVRLGLAEQARASG